MKPKSAQVWDALHAVHTHLGATLESETRASAGLSLALLDALRVLASAESQFTMAELAKGMVLSRTRVSRIVDELAVAGLAARAANPDDGRSSFVRLTAEGRRRLASALPEYEATLKQELDNALTTPQLEQLLLSLEAIQENVQERRSGTLSVVASAADHQPTK